MIVPTFKPQRSLPVTTIAIYALAIVGIGLLVYFGGSIIKNFGNLRGKSALSVNTLYGSAEVYVNNEFLGATPIESVDAKAGESKVTVKSTDITYEVTLDFIPDTQVVINRDLGVSDALSSGQNFWIEKDETGTVLSIISDPSDTKVYIDNTEVGRTPYSADNLSEGEYNLKLEKNGYELQEARIKIQKGYKLNVSVKLFPAVTPAKVELLEGSTNLYDINSGDSMVTSDTSSWVKGIIYWNRTRGINLQGSGVNKELVFSYFIDYNGKVYDREGKETDPSKLKLESGVKGAYLRKSSEAGLSDAAKTAAGLIGTVSTGKKAKIIETGTGWLRVRDAAGLSGEEVGKVDVGKEYALLEEGTGWVKIKVSAELEGWVSSTYVEIIE